ncbi:AAA family ATPase [Enterococcus faecalis]|jgi:hypothetical protein|uniref:AAA family ATPase n=1 Tax=Enterococcus faecalis TaxID=1351 RepID=UPI000990BAFC|nr:AAA family ATPase [Enterococcus faecalis]EGO5081324.1 AAA domain-containing protein [Enterococcus faecalis]EGO7589772.1 AAA domain-containing protein [Enterococcus faecalis]EGO7778041.1 AAA domain-containing protein [Enterococcus faecalis]EGO7817173.1 AAA domain-containing protein [Enterococcus faecalis]EGO7950810.1 AAA domain-containing protein [Enterococcus faecalis]
MIRPESIKDYDALDLKLGIKSSLPKVRSTLALAILFSEVTELKSEIYYSKDRGDRIEISDYLKNQLITALSTIIDEYSLTEETVLEKIHSNALFTAQLESLIVTFELIWKYAEIDFVADMSASSERTGRKRFEKVLRLTTNADLLHNIMSNNIDGYYHVLSKWIGLPVSFDERLEKTLISTLSIFSEEAVFKLVDSNEDLVFNQEGIYQALIDNQDSVNLKSDLEPKGPLRILNTLLKESLNPHVNYSNWLVSEADEDSYKLEQYKQRVDNYLKLSSKRIDTKFVEVDASSKKTELENSDSVVFNTSIKTGFPHNRIIFGAPGTGKSYSLDSDKDELLSCGGEFERVTFHEDYSYAHFVGTYKPTMIEADKKFLDLSTFEKETLSILENSELSGQEKYDRLYDKFKDEKDGLTILPILIGLYSNDSFSTKNKDGTSASGNNSFERNHGRAIRPFVTLLHERNEKEEIGYEYVPGPFMRMYVKALKNARTEQPKPHLLIIEEINRATVARVFGDVFQLLDRDSENISEYPIEASEDIKKYLSKELGGQPEDYKKIRIPNNMFLWATMNSADQGVKPMDTAFKRRWDFNYIGIDNGEEKIAGKKVELGQGTNKRLVEWNCLRKAINNELVSYKLNEDKLLGPFFLSLKNLGEGDIIDSTTFIRAFKSKVLMYLFEDAAKAKRKSLFVGAGDDFNRYSSIVKVFEEKGIFLFGSSIYKELDSFPEGD